MGDKKIVVATPTAPRQVKLISGIIAFSEETFSVCEEGLVRRFGPVDYKSDISKFDFTDYYQKDMGSNLLRQFVSFEKLIDPADISEIKLYTNRLEESISAKVKGLNRPVNIDPGYITEAKLVLATTKDYAHRIYLGNGIYAEVTLFFRDGAFRYFEWTYPDYRTKDYIKIFTDIRALFLKQKGVK